MYKQQEKAKKKKKVNANPLTEEQWNLFIAASFCLQSWRGKLWNVCHKTEENKPV